MASLSQVHWMIPQMTLNDTGSKCPLSALIVPRAQEFSHFRTAELRYWVKSQIQTCALNDSKIAFNTTRSRVRPICNIYYPTSHKIQSFCSKDCCFVLELKVILRNKRPMDLDDPLEKPTWTFAKVQKLHIRSLSQGVEIELSFALWTAVPEIRRPFSKLPYLGMKLGHWPKCQMLHIYSFSTPGGRN